MKRFLASLLAALIALPYVPAEAATLWISTTGVDSGNCQGSDCRTWAYVLSSARLSAGDTVTVRNGTYGAGNSNGYIDVDCSSGYNTGTSGNPITIRAENERQAHILNVTGSSRGTDAARISNCAYWIIEGLHIENVDENNVTDICDAGGGNILKVSDSNNITIRYNLLLKTNRWCLGAHGLHLDDVTNSLVEENELSKFHRHGYLVRNSGAGVGTNIIRRNYANSQSYAALAAEQLYTDKGDSAFITYASTGNIFENNIAESAGQGFDTIANGIDSGNIWAGNIAYGLTYGALPTQNSPPTGHEPTNDTHKDFVVVNSLAAGFYARGIFGQRCDNCTFIGNAGSGFVADKASEQSAQAYTIFADNMLSINNGGFGASVSGDISGAWLIDYPWLNGNTSGASTPAVTDAKITNEQTGSGHGMGACYLWQPDGSALVGSGKSGANIGARILYRYEGGVQQTGDANRLWHPTTGAALFARAIISGVNDTGQGAVLANIQDRLNIGINGCAFPVGYATAVAFKASGQVIISGRTTLSPTVISYILNMTGGRITQASGSGSIKRAEQ